MTPRAPRRILATATAILATTALAACGTSGPSTSPLSAQDNTDFVGGCTHTGAKAALCECIYTQLTVKQGYTSEAKLNTLTKDATTYKGAVVRAALACKTA